MPDRIARLLAVTEAALAHLTLSELLDELLVRIREPVQADAVGARKLDDGSEQLVARQGLAQDLARRVAVSIGCASTLFFERPLAEADVEVAA